MMIKEPYMVHSLISSSINLGLLMAKDVVAKVVKAYHDGLAQIEAVEGFVRQVLGWREYIRGIYLIEMKNNYHLSNSLKHKNKLPSFFYNANTKLNCLHQVIDETNKFAYNHHIQRLMIIGNISNLLEISPKAIRRWFNEMYIDSFDWVVTPNVVGMALYADGGKMSKSSGTADTIYLADEAKTLSKKIMRAVTDEGPQKENSEKSSAIQNIFDLMELVSTSDTIDHFNTAYANCYIRYGELKK